MKFDKYENQNNDYVKTPGPLKDFIDIFTSFSDEVLSILKDKDFEKMVKTLAIDMGAEKTLQNLKNYIDMLKPPVTKQVDGITYMAGYNGINMVPVGKHKAELKEITSDKKQVKLMFVIDGTNRYLYHNVLKDRTTIDECLVLAQKINKKADVEVVKETLPNGEYHALISGIEWI